MTGPIRKRYPDYQEHPRAPYYYPDRGDGLARRRTTRLTVTDIDSDGLSRGWFTLPGTAGAVLLDVRAYQELWLRLFASEEEYLLDAARTDRDVLPPDGPLIADLLFSDPSALSADALDTTAWAAGPGCTNAAGGTSEDDGGFAATLDGDADTCWTAGGWFQANGQTIGDTFSIDMGAEASFQAFDLDTFPGSDAYPETFSVETSTDGVIWTMQDSAVPGGEYMRVDLPAPVTARYVRFKIVTTRAAEWAISRVVAYAPPQLISHIELFDGDVRGVLAFNWNNPAANRLYYALEVADVTRLGHIFSDNFEKYTKVCTIREFFISAEGGLHIVWGVSETGVAQCDLLNQSQPNIHMHTAWDGAEYVDVGTARPRFYYDHFQLRGQVGGESIGRFPALPANRSSTGCNAALHRGSTVLDPTSWSFYFYAYLLNDGILGSWDTKSRLGIGVVRTSATEVGANIQVWNENNEVGDLATVGGISLSADTVMDFRARVDIVAGVPTARLYNGATLLLSAEIPQWLLDLENHSHVGIGMTTATVPDAEDAEPDWGLDSLTVLGATAGLNIDLGYVPIERPGGTLSPPTVPAQ